jgi:hypothetical protein
MSALSDLLAAQQAIESLAADPGTDQLQLQRAVQAALAPPAPPGSPADVHAVAAAWASTAAQCGQASTDLGAVSTTSIPQVWQGQAADTAAQAVAALGTEIQETQQTLAAVGKVLGAWAEALTWAQAKDAAGVSALSSAAATLATIDITSEAPIKAALPDATSGVADRVAAAQHVQNSAPGTIAALKQYAEAVRASDLEDSGLDPITDVVLANAANPGATDGDAVDDGQILSPAVLSRADASLTALSAADQATFNSLLAGAKSPQEAAYLWKALAAGNSIAQLEQFESLIRPHGNDPVWLAQHLDLNLSAAAAAGPGERDYLMYEGSAGGQYDPNGYDLYDQGTVNDCVSASTVIAAADVDPVLMLQLTTGAYDKPGSNPPPGLDTQAALQQRLQQVYVAEYNLGKANDNIGNRIEHFFGIDENGGINTDGENYLANSYLAPRSGTSYSYKGLTSAAQRQAVLPQIEAAASEGTPVPFDVTDGGSGHQMLIIGSENGNLLVYNPWGFTEWVSGSDFVNGKLQGLTGNAYAGAQYSSDDQNGLPNADGVELPSS